MTMVVVLYNQLYFDSLTLKGIKEYLTLKPHSVTVNLLIYDNSFNKQKISEEFFPLTENITLLYIHDETNPGLVKPYNIAIKMALDNKSDWLITFDQDTHIDIKYFSELEKIVVTDLNENIVAIVPTVICNNTIVSPIKFEQRTFTPYRGKCEKILSNYNCINSASVYRVCFLQAIKGYNTNFKLNFVDAWIFDTIAYEKKRILLMDCVIEHDYSSIVNPQFNYKKYKQGLLTDVLFYKTCRGTVFNIKHSLGNIFMAILSIFLFRNARQNFLRLTTSINHFFALPKPRYNNTAPWDYE